MVKEGLINLDFADVRAVMRGMGKAMMGTGEASGEDRARHAAEAAIANPLLDDVSMQGARGLLISITGGPDLTLYEVDEAASRIREEVDGDANIILGATFDPMTSTARSGFPWLRRAPRRPWCRHWSRSSRMPARAISVKRPAPAAAPAAESAPAEPQFSRQRQLLSRRPRMPSKTRSRRRFRRGHSVDRPVVAPSIIG